MNPLDLQAPYTFGAQLEARAQHPEIGARIFLRHADRCLTYREYRDECVRIAHFLLARLGEVDDAHPAHVAILLENNVELLTIFGACAYAGATLFGINTGLRGEVLAGVINGSEARILVVDERLLDRVEAIAGSLTNVTADNILVVPTAGERSLDEARLLDACATREIAKSGAELAPPDVTVEPDANLMVIYTSGTTGLPKGINNNHFKLLTIGRVVSGNLELGADDCGYACMPLFHSNAIFLGFMPAFTVGASLAMRERFSASGFVPDLLRYGVTFWNYVGEPVHYILAAIREAYDGDEDRILRELAAHPDNRLRYALGNGASPPDMDKFMRWLGLEDMFELYGSTEAAISTFRRKSDPRGSVGEVTDESVKIIGEQGQVCPPAELDADGKITNYAEAVGEICRVAPDTALFQGYYRNDEANSSKYRDGVYHSGDLGHILEREGRRFLFFDGRTDDWIRKDGENFSAGQAGRMISEHPDIALAAAYGVPCPVSDELVMVAIKLVPGARFDPQGFFDFCEEQATHGGMDRKWFPDFVRVVDEFTYTQTQKILVRDLKAEHFDRRRLPDAALYWRRRGSTTFEPFDLSDFERFREEFVAAERDGLLDR